ncbi:ogr/Delta-like zinc finger family protein [Citrobacter freundii]|uniref:ogr/Delta-like zinc finger family protein n=1 Tax=Citrobacter freundii TaxID=546 RepID=UPI0034DCF291
MKTRFHRGRILFFIFTVTITANRYTLATLFQTLISWRASLTHRKCRMHYRHLDNHHYDVRECCPVEKAPMRIKCPACQGKSRIFRVVRKENHLVDLFCDCENPDCCARFVMNVEYLRHVKKMRKRKQALALLLSDINKLTYFEQQDLQSRIAWKEKPAQL